MTAIIKLTTAGSSSGPFNIYSNLDGFLSAFAINISRANLLAGFPSNNMPNGTTTVRISSTGTCANHIDIPV